MEVNREHLRKNNAVDKLCMILILAAVIVLEAWAETRTWKYPDYNIVRTESGFINWYLLRIAVVLLFSVLLSATKYFWSKSKIRIGILFALAGVTIYLAWLLMNGSWVAYELQQLMIGGYVIWCYGLSKLGKRCLDPRGGSIVYLVFGIGSMWFSNYSCLYEEATSGRPLTILYLAMIFMIVYAEIFWKDLWISLKEKKRRIAILTVGMAAVFSYKRLWEIFQSITESAASGYQGYQASNWFLYRVNVWRAILTGQYRDTWLDIPGKVAVQNFHMTWLGYAFDRKYQYLYLFLLAAFLGLLGYMLRKSESRSSFYFVLIQSILLTNIGGIIAEINLFWGADIGVFLTQNVYQIMPIVFLYSEISSITSPCIY